MKDITDLRINTENKFAFEKELKEQPARLHEAGILKAEAETKVDRLELKLKIKTAEIVAELCEEASKKGKPIPKSAIQELKNTSVPLRKEWQELNYKLIEANEECSNMKSLVKAHESIGYRLGELGKHMENMMNDGLVIYDKGKRLETELSKLSEELEL